MFKLKIRVILLLRREAAAADTCPQTKFICVRSHKRIRLSSLIESPDSHINLELAGSAFNNRFRTVSRGRAIGSTASRLIDPYFNYKPAGVRVENGLGEQKRDKTLPNKSKLL